MPFNITEVDGVVVNPNTKKFPVEVTPEVHVMSGPQHTGKVATSQLPDDVMLDAEHQGDPHTMIIDGRDVSIDGLKLDTIETGAQVNNLTDQQANSLVGGAHTNWHHHDDWYYRKTSVGEDMLITRIEIVLDDCREYREGLQGLALPPAYKGKRG